MDDRMPVTGWMWLRIAAPLTVSATLLMRLALDWPSGRALAVITLLGAVGWLVGRVGQWIDDELRRRAAR